MTEQDAALLKAFKADLEAKAKQEAYTLRRKLMNITVQRDRWKEAATRYRKILLEKK